MLTAGCTGHIALTPDVDDPGQVWLGSCASHEIPPADGTPVGTWHHGNLSYSRRTASSMMVSAQWSTLLAPHSVQTPTWMVTRQNTYPLSVRWRKATSCLHLIARPRLQKAQVYSSLRLAMLLNRVWASGGDHCVPNGELEHVNQFTLGNIRYHSGRWPPTARTLDLTIHAQTLFANETTTNLVGIIISDRARRPASISADGPLWLSPLQLSP